VKVNILKVKISFNENFKQLKQIKELVLIDANFNISNVQFFIVS